jgi:hypothetical protein
MVRKGSERKIADVSFTKDMAVEGLHHPETPARCEFGGEKGTKSLVRSRARNKTALKQRTLVDGRDSYAELEGGASKTCKFLFWASTFHNK